MIDTLGEFYDLLSRLADKTGGRRSLGSANGRMIWPRRGVYFFFEPGETRSGSGTRNRVVRVGTHALRVGSRSTLWGRLSQHRGSSDGGNHRGSIFRLLVGLALQARDPSLAVASWGKGTSASPEIVEAERDLEKAVSVVLSQMDVLWLAIDDEPGPDSLRGYIERNAIALLSAHRSEALDPPSPEWLGRYCPRDRVRTSGLWNSNHVGEPIDLNLVKTFERLITGRVGSTFGNSATHPAVVRQPAPLASPAHSGGNASRIVEALRKRPDLDDDALSIRSGVKPRQQVNIICRQLEQRGLVKRFVGPAGKILNRLTDQTASIELAEHARPTTKSAQSAPAKEPLRLRPLTPETLVIIPCSGRKATGSRVGSPMAVLLDDLPVELARRLVLARKALAAKAHLNESTLMPAWRRNSGMLYQAAFPSRDGSSLHPSLKHLLILSGGYGILRAADAIGTYDLAMREAFWPRGLLQEVIEAYARHHQLHRAVAFASETTDYAKVLRKVDWGSAGVTDAVLLSPPPSTGAMVKAPRAIGEALRTSMADGLTDSWRSSDGLRLVLHRLS